MPALAQYKSEKHLNLNLNQIVCVDYRKAIRIFFCDYCNMEKLPYELLFCIAQYLDSPRDLCTFSEISSIFYQVSRDERLWKHLCIRLYSCDHTTTTYYSLFTKILVPYGRYLGYWKSNQPCFGGLISVKLNPAEGHIDAIRLSCPSRLHAMEDLFLLHEEDDSEEEFMESPVLDEQFLFTIDTKSNHIYCHKCDQQNHQLQWRQSLNRIPYEFGLSHQLLSSDELYSLISRDSAEIDANQTADVFFIQSCPLIDTSIVYRPFAASKPSKNPNDHLLKRFNGIWMGTYGGHGFELLDLRYVPNFQCPVVADGFDHLAGVFSDALVARKITGDPNVPHGQISFVAIRRCESHTENILDYQGVGQIAQTGYFEPQFIRVRIRFLSDDLLKITWHALHHTSSLKRCNL